MRPHDILQMRRVVAEYEVGLKEEFQAEALRLEGLLAEIQKAQGVSSTIASATKLREEAEDYASGIQLAAVKSLEEAKAVLARAEESLAEAEEKNRLAEERMLEAKRAAEKVQLELVAIRGEVSKAQARQNELVSTNAIWEKEIAAKETSLANREGALARRLALLREPVL